MDVHDTRAASRALRNEQKRRDGDARLTLVDQLLDAVTRACDLTEWTRLHSGIAFLESNQLAHLFGGHAAPLQLLSPLLIQRENRLTAKRCRHLPGRRAVQIGLAQRDNLDLRPLLIHAL